MDYTDLALKLSLIAQRAGAEIIAIKNKFDKKNIQLKGDGSPVTVADLTAHQLICDNIRKICPRIPIVSEEGSIGDPETSQLCFLVDPLDGTKEFIKGNGMYSVNIALTERKDNGRWKTILGVVNAPEFGTTWFGGDGVEATRQQSNKIINVRVGSNSDLPIVLGSVSHRSPKDETFLQELGRHIFEGVGSSIKICRVADGSADLSPRFGPTSCWDTAAAHAVLNSAGGNLLGPDGEELDYDLVNDLLNPPFLATYDSKWVETWLNHQD